MGYWGTVVVARPDGSLAQQDGVAGFGHQHHWLRELGGGWQMLEASGFDDPPDLRAACEAVVASTGRPVLAAYVSDSYCAVMCAAVPGRVGALTHLWDVSGPCGAFRHQPHGMADPVGRRLDEVVAELIAWAEAAGFRPDGERIRLVLSRDDDSQVEDLVFELIRTLGVERIGRTLPWSLPAYDWPFSAIVSPSGPVARARGHARERADGSDLPPPPAWEVAALALEAEMWASLYRPGIDVIALARRAAALCADFQAARKPRNTAEPEPPTTAPAVLDPADAEMLAALECALAAGAAPRWSAEIRAREHADARSTDRA